VERFNNCDILGSAWCTVCPWDTIATWLVHRRLWNRFDPYTSLNLQVPKQLHNVLPALFLFIILTWLELGVGVTINPYATASLSLLMIILATVSLAIRELLIINVWQLSPMILFAILATGYHLWLLMEPMVIRMSGVCLPINM